MKNKDLQEDSLQPGYTASRSVNTVPHGIMFHHFWDGKRKSVVGATTTEQLEKVISYYGVDNIIPAKDWFQEATKGRFTGNKTCITLDDALRSQIDYALPILDRYGLTAFWFIYSSVFEEKASNFEIFRYFSAVCFDSFDEFFYAFMSYLAKKENTSLLKSGRRAFVKSGHLQEYVFYTSREREFRFFRDKVLGREKVEILMGCMLADSGASHDELSSGLWMTNDDLIDLTREGHVIGLHSYSHPTELNSLSYDDQKEEYQKNMNHIEKVTGSRPKVVSHPVNSYDQKTLAILGAMGVEIGFRSNMFKVNHGALEYPRADCTDVIEQMSN